MLELSTRLSSSTGRRSAIGEIGPGSKGSGIPTTVSCSFPVAASNLQSTTCRYMRRTARSLLPFTGRNEIILNGTCSPPNAAEKEREFGCLIGTSISSLSLFSASVDRIGPAVRGLTPFLPALPNVFSATYASFMTEGGQSPRSASKEHVDLNRCILLSSLWQRLSTHSNLALLSRDDFNSLSRKINFNSAAFLSSLAFYLC